MRPSILRGAQILMILALLLASGGQWVALQGVAWGCMLLDYSRHTKLAEAVACTFDGKHPCALCKTIERGRQSEKKPELKAEFAKLDLFFDTTVDVVRPHPSNVSRVICDSRGESRPSEPLLQPPRQGAV